MFRSRRLRSAGRSTVAVAALIALGCTTNPGNTYAYGLPPSTEAPSPTHVTNPPIAVSPSPPLQQASPSPGAATPVDTMPAVDHVADHSSFLLPAVAIMRVSTEIAFPSDRYFAQDGPLAAAATKNWKGVELIDLQAQAITQLVQAHGHQSILGVDLSGSRVGWTIGEWSGNQHDPVRDAGVAGLVRLRTGFRTRRAYRGRIWQEHRCAGMRSS